MKRRNVLFVIWQKLMGRLFRKKEGHKERSSENASLKTKVLTESVGLFLRSRYDFRYNVLTEETEYRPLIRLEEIFRPINQRVLNTMCLEAHEAGIACWDRDLLRCVYSTVLLNIIRLNYI